MIVKEGRVYNPVNKIDSKIEDIYIENGIIIESPNNENKYSGVVIPAATAGIEAEGTAYSL